MKQAELFALSIQERVCGLLVGKWLTPYDLQKEYHELTGVWMSGGSCGEIIFAVSARRCV
jgi:hypothetical protein